MKNFGQSVRTAALAALSISAFNSFADNAPAVYDRGTAKASFKRPASVSYPADNQSTPERVALGKALFFEPRLSRANTVSCATCHNPAFSWGDGLPKGVGHSHKELGRRTPTVLNTAFCDLLFWDGRAESLEEQALGPIASAGEMNMPLPEMIEKVKSICGYKPMFEAAYPGQGITAKVVGKAIATFERTVVSAPAPFDKWIEGNESAIPESAKRGFDLFNAKANCVKCHSGWNFSDSGFHDIGVADADPGRGKLLPQLESMQHAFKTPTLRNVDHRGPYLHDGSEKSLEDVVAFYNLGGKARRPSLAAEIKPLNLTAAETKDLCDFMATLTSHDSSVTIPVLPR